MLLVSVCQSFAGPPCAEKAISLGYDGVHLITQLAIPFEFHDPPVVKTVDGLKRVVTLNDIHSMHRVIIV